jgi:hypothetical protein
MVAWPYVKDTKAISHAMRSRNHAFHVVPFACFEVDEVEAVLYPVQIGLSQQMRDEGWNKLLCSPEDVYTVR